MRHALTLLPFFVAAAVAGGCVGEPPPDAPEPARLEILTAIDPDLSNPAAPVAARVVWVSTRAGTGRFLSEGRELTADRAPVSGGEITTTDIPPIRLEPGINDVQLYFVVQDQGSSTLTADFRLFVDAECTLHDHCVGGPCEQFSCVEP